METQTLQSIYNQLNDCSLNTLPKPRAYKTDMCSVLQLCFNEGFLVYYSFGQERLSKDTTIADQHPLVIWVMSGQETDGIIVGVYDGQVPDPILNFAKNAHSYTKQSSDHLMMYLIINMGTNISRVAKTLMIFNQKEFETKLVITPGISPRFFIEINSNIVIEPRHHDSAYSVTNNSSTITGIFNDPYNMPKDLLQALELAA